VHIPNLAERLRRGEMHITRGFAFRAKLPVRSDVDHICIVLNKKAVPGRDILCIYLTSKGIKATQHMRNDPAALVTVQPAEYGSITMTSYIQCSKAFIQHVRFDDFLANVELGSYDCSVERPNQALLDRIFLALTNSRTFSTQDLKIFE
jgi:hypothetical protein